MERECLRSVANFSDKTFYQKPRRKSGFSCYTVSMRLSKILYIIVILIGLCSRAYLAYILPIWLDEAYSIWVSTRPLIHIITGITGTVHPPGYYVLLKLWGTVSLHLYWMRLLGILFFGLNLFLLYKIGNTLRIFKYFSFFLISLYAFSGYFLVFDWQVRMYASLLSFILMSIYILLHWTKEKTFSKSLFASFTAVDACGLYFDYGFLWYILPFTFYSAFVFFRSKDAHYGRVLFSLIMSLCLFALWYPNVILEYKYAVAGIQWMINYLAPFYVLSYLLGTHSNILFTVVFSILVGIGTYVISNRRKILFPLPQVGLVTILFAYFVYIFSLLFFPIFHLRSYQIIAIVFLFLTASSLSFLWQKKCYLLFFLSYGMVFVNFVSIFLTLPNTPGQFLISFFPWKNIRKDIENKQYTRIVYRKVDESTDPILQWGLVYTLDGFETWPSKPIAYSELTENGADQNECDPIPNGLLEIYGCYK